MSNNSSISNKTRDNHVAPGMPTLDMQGKTVSFFEFWPTWLIYIPVVVYWLLLSIRYRSLTLPLLANPELPLSGMVGVPKSQLLAQATNLCKETILPWFIYTTDHSDPQDQLADACSQIAARKFSFPLVCKPDIGCRGAGVRLVSNQKELSDYLQSYPRGADIMVQQLATYEPEVGIFFVREPQQAEGKIISLALKYSPYVVGDGQHTLVELIKQDTRAGKLAHLYTERHQEQLDRVLADGETFKLVFSASHCRGAIFRDGEELITPALVRRINEILRDLPEFYYGRMDVKFADTEALKRGEQLEIVEINAASSESLHIWDSNTGFLEAIKSLLKQYGLLFKIGQQNRQRGYQPPGVVMLFKHWMLERRLTRLYPSTD